MKKEDVTLGNSLNNIIAERKIISFSQSMTNANEAYKEVKWLIDNLEKIPVFDFGQISNYHGFKVVHHNLMLPFNDVIFKFTEKNDDLYVNVCKESDVEGDYFSWTTFWRNNISGGICISDMFTTKNLTDGQYYPYDFHDGMDERVTQIKTVIAVFLSVMNCTNVKKIKNEPSAKLNKSRIKKGKLPLVSVWTLEIDNSKLPSMVSSECGGTHAAPRVHLRRGHLRQYQPEKWCWVQSSVVGSGPGLIKKSYSVKPPAK